MATEFRTTLDHGTYILSALVKSDSKVVELFRIGERENGETRILEDGVESFHSFEMKELADGPEAFRDEYSAWLGAGGKEELEGVLNPISVFNIRAVEPDRIILPGDEEELVAEKPKPKAKPRAKKKK